MCWFGNTSRKCDEILLKLDNLHIQGDKIMAIAQQILDAVTAETTKLDSFLALIQGLINDNTIPAEVGVQILEAINSNRVKLEEAIEANTTPVPPVME
jgi:hypothetical protein